MRKRLSSLVVAMLVAAVMVVGIPMTAYAGSGDYNKGRSCGCYKKHKPIRHNKCRVIKHHKKCKIVKYKKRHKKVRRHGGYNNGGHNGGGRG